MKVHIGKIIKTSVKKSGLTVTAFAGKINCTRRNAYDIFEKETIDTGMLSKISRVVGENLFLHYISEKELFEAKSKKTSIENLTEVLVKLTNEADRITSAREGIEKSAKKVKSKK